MNEPLTPRAAQIRLAQYGERTKTWSTATYDSGAEKALYEIALTLSAELDRVRLEAGRALQLLMAAQGYEAARILDEIGVEPAAGRAES